MLTTFSLALLSTGALATSASARLPLTDYPAVVNPSARVEAVIERGLTQELIVKCDGGVTIVSYSKVEKLYCGPNARCHARLAVILARTCGKH